MGRPHPARQFASLVSKTKRQENFAIPDTTAKRLHWVAKELSFNEHSDKLYTCWVRWHSSSSGQQAPPKQTPPWLTRTWLEGGWGG